MAEILAELQLIVRQIVVALGYPGVFLAMLVENLFPPIPSEIVMPLAGFLIFEQRMTFLGVMLAGTLGSVLGAAVIYNLGLRLGEERLFAWVRKWGKYFLVSERDLGKAMATFKRHGKAAILFGRLIPGVRSLISIPAGMARMDLSLFLALTSIGSLAWNALLALAGVYLGRNWTRILEIIETYELIIWVSLAILVLFLVYRRLRRRLGAK